MIQADIFNPVNFLNAGIAQNMMNMVQTSDDIGVATLKQCADKEGKFTFDAASSVQDPSPIVKGKDVTFDMEGIVASPMDVSKIHLHVNWNGTPLYDQDYKVGQHFDASFDYKMKWFVPSYAPAGKYAITLTGYDQDGSTSDMCVGATFQL